MQRRLRTVLVGAFGAVFAALVLTMPLPATAQRTASPVVDRTLSCSVSARAGVRRIDVSAQVGVRLFGDRTKWKYLANASVDDDSQTGGVWVGAGNPLAPLQPGFPAPPERLSMPAGPKCRVVKTLVALSTAGLRRRDVGPLPDRGSECPAGGRVLVRVRAIFAAPTTVRFKRYAGGVSRFVASGTVTEARMAIRAPAGAPLGYAEVFESGKARLFTATSCVQD